MKDYEVRYYSPTYGRALYGTYLVKEAAAKAVSDFLGYIEASGLDARDKAALRKSVHVE